MSDVAELERRLSAALERIARGVEQIGAPEQPDGAPQGAAEIEQLRETLEAERSANAQLELRVVALTEKQEKLVAGLEAEVARLRGELDARDSMIRQVKQVNQRLRESVRALRSEQPDGDAAARAIDQSMRAELDGLRLSRESDRAELDAILRELKPIVEGGADA